MEITSFYRLGPERFLRIDARSDDARPVSDQPFPSSFAELAAYDLVVVGNRGNSRISSLVVGSTASKVARYAHCSVLIYRPGYEPI